MLFLPVASLPGLFLVAMTPEAPRDTVMLEIERDGNQVKLRLIGESPVTQRVRYDMAFQGQSTSQHRGTATLDAEQRNILSTMRMSVNGHWCVKVTVEEEGGRRYELGGGECWKGD